MPDWRDIASAPRDGTPIIGWCVHEADPYFETDKRLTVYGSHCEGLSRVEDGPHIVQWGGEDSDYDEFRDEVYHIPAWWFRYGSDFEEVANPTHWMPLPNPPSA